MDPISIAMLGSTALSTGANLFGGMMGSSGQAATNAQQMGLAYSQMQWNSAEAQKQRDWSGNQAQIARDWSEQMSGTAYQRAMKDMYAAGLNPILAYSQGGASTPGAPIGSGAAASSGGMPSLGNPGASMQAGMAALGNAVGHSAQVKATLNQAAKDETQSDLNKAQEKSTDATTDLTKEATKRTVQDTATGAATEDAQRAAATAARAQTAVHAANVGLILQQTNSAAEAAKQAAMATQDMARYGVPRNESVGGLVGRVLRQYGPGIVDVPHSARSMPDMRPGVPGSPVFGPTTRWNTP